MCIHIRLFSEKYVCEETDNATHVSYGHVIIVAFL